MKTKEAFYLLCVERLKRRIKYCECRNGSCSMCVNDNLMLERYEKAGQPDEEPCSILHFEKDHE